MEKLNNDKKVDSQITSRYTIVLAAAKRARQIIDGANPLTYAPTDKAVSISIKELSEGRLLIKADPDSIDNLPERNAQALYYQSLSSVSKDDLREDFKDKYEPVDADEDDYGDEYKYDESYNEDEEYEKEFDEDEEETEDADEDTMTDYVEI
jgi:DNA-directed RNA polymerase subunit omega